MRESRDAITFCTGPDVSRHHSFFPNKIAIMRTQHSRSLRPIFTRRSQRLKGRFFIKIKYCDDLDSKGKVQGHRHILFRSLAYPNQLLYQNDNNRRPL